MNVFMHITDIQVVIPSLADARAAIDPLSAKNMEKYAKKFKFLER